MAEQNSTQPPSPPTIGLRSAVAVVVGNMIGASIYIALHFNASALPDAISILTVWVLGGLIAWCGAVSYGELAAALPGNGGEANYLSRIYHPSVGFLSGWVSLVAGFPGPIAVIALAFGKYFVAGYLPDMSEESAPVVARSIGLGVIALVAAFHLTTLKLTSSIHFVLTAVKYLLLAGLAVSAFVFAKEPQVAGFQPSQDTVRSFWSNAFFVQLYFALYAYSGWNAACYIAKEVRDPQKNVPRALFLGVGLVTVLYVGLNAGMLWLLPKQTLADNFEVAHVTAQTLFGENGSRFVTALICIGMVSAISAMIWAGSRVGQRLGTENPLLRPLAMENRHQIPAFSVIFQAVVAAILLLAFEKPDAILLYVELLLQVFLFLTVLGVFVLRRKQPDLPRPYKALGYPILPGIFLIWVVLTATQVLRMNHELAIKGLSTIIIGWLVWWFSKPVPARKR
jgi:APA family basic amino acid/polyamine antiporter